MTAVRRATSTIPVLLAGIAVVCGLATIVLAWGRPSADGFGTFGFGGATRVLAFTAYALIGAVVAVKRPSNPIGWLFVVGGTAMSAQLGLEEYAHAAFVLDPSGQYPGAVAVDWVAEWLWVVPMSCLQFSTLLFPTGRLPSRGWRAYAALLVVGDVLLLVLTPVATWPLRGRLAGEEVLVDSPLWVVVGPLAVAMAAAVVLSALALPVRFRAARGDERYQLRWLAFAAAVFVAGITVENVLGVSVVHGEGAARTWPALAGSLGTIAVPLAAAFAILKRRLYEIDRVISRAVAYVVVSLVLAGGYLGLVVVLGSTATAVTGSSGDLVVALATLAVAACFQPVRVHVQSGVDRRFNRARYDAARTIDAFGRSMRDQVSRDAVLDALRMTTAATFQPASVSVLLPGGGPR